MVLIDAIALKIRDGRVANRPVYVAMGITVDGERDVLGLWAGCAASKRVPSPVAAVIVSGVLILLGGLSVLLGVWPDLGALLLIVFLVPTAILMHGFWRERDPMMRQNDQVHFMKDLALAGAALVMLAFFAYAGHDLGLTLTGPLFDLR